MNLQVKKLNDSKLETIFGGVKTKYVILSNGTCGIVQTLTEEEMEKAAEGMAWCTFVAVIALAIVGTGCGVYKFGSWVHEKLS